MEYVNGGEVSLKKTFCTSDSSAATGLHWVIGHNLSLFPCFLLSLNCLLGLFFLQFFFTVLWKKRKVDLFFLNYDTLLHS